MNSRLLLSCMLVLISGAVVWAQGAASAPPRVPPPLSEARPSPAQPVPPAEQAPAQALPATPPPPPVVQVVPAPREMPLPADLLRIPQRLGRPLPFIAVFLLVGLFFRVLVRRITAAGSDETRYGGAPDLRVARRVATGDLIVWAAALVLASEAVGLGWFAPLGALVTGLLHLVGSLIAGLFWLVAAAIVAYAISPRGQDIVLGLVGWAYLRRTADSPLTGREIDLGSGVKARWVSTDGLHSVLQAADGQVYRVPNAWLMRTQFNWGEPPCGPAHVPPPAPPPPPGR